MSTMDRPPIIVDLVNVTILAVLGYYLTTIPTALPALARIGGLGAMMAAGMIFVTVLKERGIL